MTYIPTKDLTRGEWLNMRKSYIGASDWGTVLGQNKWKTPRDLYCDKIGEADPQEDNIKMKFGRDAEGIVAGWFHEETGLTVINDNKIRYSKEYPFLATNLDRVIRDSGDGKPAVLEIKTMGSGYYKKTQEEGLELPLSYFSQIQGQLYVTGWEKAYVAVLVFGFSGPERFKIIDFDRDNEYINLAIPKLKAFWECVENKTPPEPTVDDDLSSVFNEADPGKEIEATPELLEDVEKYDTMQAQIKLMQNQLKELRSMIQLAMGGAEYLKHQGEVLHTWKQVKPRTLFDIKRFRSDHPDLADQYTKLGKPSRRFV